MIKNYTIILPALCLLLIWSCKSPNKPAETQPRLTNAEKDRMIKEQFVRANKQVTMKENDEMDYYGKTHRMPFVRTGSGVRYFVYKPSAQGDSIKKGMSVTMDFKVKLLDGTECYSSKNEGPKTFVIGEDNIESGIHKGLQYLKRGDKAILLIPSVLAHGLLGDMNKIPPQMPILYDVQIH